MTFLIKRVLSSGVYGLLAKISTSLSQILFIPLMLENFGKEEFGILVTLVSLTSFISLSSFGVSKSMQNKLGKLDDLKSNYEKYLVYFSSAKFISKWSFVTVLGILIFYLVVDSVYDFGISSLVIIFLVSSFFIVQVNTILDFYRGVQHPQIANKISFLISLVTIFFTATSLFFNFQSEVFYFLVYGLPQLMVIIFFAFKNLENFRKAHSKNGGLVVENFDRVAKGFLVLTIIQFAGFGSDTFLVTVILGAENSAEYNIVLRFYTFLLFGFSVFSGSLWPFITKLHANFRFKDIINLLNKALFIAIAYGIIAALILSFIVPEFVSRFMDIEISSNIYFALALQLLVVVYTSLIIPFLNSMNHLAVQINYGIANVIFNAILSVILMNALGTYGTSVATAVAHLLLGAIPLTFHLYRELKIESNRNNKKSILAKRTA
ncbi:lipopolysaccharide biosynthesis protein [Thalassotalea maritima]|uniref:lipopolysaccharide biosynthesis protein n=1 Tax=Thalassotalea maritima TaxID=3242416 RepID=UPI003527DE03